MTRAARSTSALINRPNEGQYIGRVDYQKSDKNSIFGRYIATTYRTPPPYNFTDNVLATTIGGRDNLAQAYTAGDTLLIGPNTVSAFRLALNRTAIHRTSRAISFRLRKSASTLTATCRITCS